MRNGSAIAVIIPALNEAPSIGRVLDDIPEWVDDTIVADNGSHDETAAVAEAHGARVVREPRRGYGAACQAGIRALRQTDVVVFLDGDYSDYPDEMAALVDPIASGQAEFVVGSRVLGRREPGALTIQARWGNWLTCTLLRLFWGIRFTDLGPFRAIRHDVLRALDMRDNDYGWTVEMQIKAAQRGLRCLEVPVRYRRRIGRSKISGTVRGVIAAGTKILATVIRAALAPPQNTSERRLVVFTRYPRAGRTKTRLIPELGAEGAARLHREMTGHTLSTAERFAGPACVPVEVRFAGGTRRLMRRWLGRRQMYRAQGRGDLGARMKRTFREAFREDAQRVVIVGTDCPGLTPAHLAEAFDALEEHDLVIGPATDGGYYLIGLRATAPADALEALMADMPWGTGEILERTLKHAADHGLRVAQLEALADVDRPEDLPIWEEVAAARPEGQPRTG